MRNIFAMLCGLAAIVLTLQPVAAETTIVLDSPLERQVFQRNAEECANLKVAGAIPSDATVVEASAELGAGLRGKAIGWTVVAKGAQIKDGRFSGSLKLAAGGWYTLKVRFRKSADDQTVLGGVAVEHVGVGDIFVVAGQSNASNHGAEQQRTTTGLVAAFDGKHWQLANDPQPGASGGQGSFQPPFGDAMAARFKVPVGIIAILLAARYLPADLPAATKTCFDTAGATLILIALITLLFPLNQGLNLGWTSPLILGSFVLSLISWILFFAHERRCEAPLVNMRLFSSRNYLLGNVAALLLMMVYNGLIFLLPFFFEIVQGRSTGFAGMLLAIPAIALMVVGPIAGSVSDRFGSRLPTTCAAILAAGTLYLFSLFSQDTGLPFIIGTMVLLGIAIGFFFPPNMSQILGSSGKDGEGVASSVMMTIRNTGAVFGVAIFGTVVGQVVISMMAHENVMSASADIQTTGFSIAFTCGILICLAGAGISAAIREERA